jgi:hypothetical protein
MDKVSSVVGVGNPAGASLVRMTSKIVLYNEVAIPPSFAEVPVQGQGLQLTSLLAVINVFPHC